ncbi:hypothetical protein AAOGI_21510 [Agarivorans albus]
MHRSEFLKLLKKELPELAENVNAEQGLLHLEVGVLKKHAQRAIYGGDRELFSKCVKLAEKSYIEGNAALKDAINVSFVEELEFYATKKASYEWAWETMPITLRQLYVSFHGNQKM